MSLFSCSVASPEADGSPQQWPGPFATAREIHRNRDAVAAARQEKINQRELEEEEILVGNLADFQIKWEPKNGKAKMVKLVPVS